MNALRPQTRASTAVPILMEATCAAVPEASTEQDRGEGTSVPRVVSHFTKMNFLSARTELCVSPRSHCITGSGFPGQFGEGEDDDSLSPEACYECKINGGGKNGRQRRNADENELSQVLLLLNLLSVLLLVSKSEAVQFV